MSHFLSRTSVLPGSTSVASLVAGLAILAAVGPASAQTTGGTSAEARRAADVITAETMAAGISVLAADSLRGRNTPSPGLNAAADFIVDRYRTMGLEPGGEDGSFYQRYPFLRRGLDAEGVALTIEAPDRGVELRYGRDFAVSGGTDGVVEGGVVAVDAGRGDVELPESVRGRVLLTPTPGSWGRDFRTLAGQQARTARSAGAVAVVHVLDEGWGRRS